MNTVRTYDDFTNEELAKAFSNPDRSINITGFKQETLDRLPVTIKARISYDGDTPLALNNVEFIGRLRTTDCPFVILPKLIHAEEIEAWDAHVQAPNLMKCKVLHAQSLNSSNYATVNNLFLYTDGTADLVGVRKIGQIFCEHATAVHLRDTEDLGIAHIPKAKLLTAPNLSSLTGSLNTQAGTHLTLGISDKFKKSLKYPFSHMPFGTGIVVISPENIVAEEDAVATGFEHTVLVHEPA